jgi:DNA-binding transcriptional regulator YdaS (Cro superfamily)
MKNKTLTNPLDALYSAIKYAGGQSALARACGIKQQTIGVWIKTGRVPAARVLQVEKAIGGRISCHDLRPDIYPRSS